MATTLCRSRLNLRSLRRRPPRQSPLPSHRTGSLVKLVDGDGKPLDKAATVYDKSRILALIHDADENKRYAFTATHFFEVVEPLNLKPHAVTKFDTANGAVALQTAFHCARAVRGLPPLPFPPAKP